MSELLPQGEIISDRYQIITFLGQGGTGTTYAAVDLQTQQRVAIKAVSLRRVQDWKVVELFEREAKILAALQHPAIPKYLDYFHCDTESDRYFYLVQELVEGESLATLVNRGWRIQEQLVKYIATQILEILQYLHSFRPPIIHRDIKPQNIIIRPDNKVYLVDFGAVQEIYRNTLSVGGTFVGTMGYISPEQFRGKVIPASDLYSLGCTLLFVLTRRSPADLPQKRMRFDFRDRLPLSLEFADWLEKMVEPAKEDRFSSAEQAIKVLQHKRPIPVAKNIRVTTNYNFRGIQKPINTRVILKRNALNLSIIIPPNDNFFKSIFWGFKEIPLAMQILFFIGFLLSIVFLLLFLFSNSILIIPYLNLSFHFPYLIALLLFCFFIVFSIIVIFNSKYLERMEKKHELRIDPQNFSIIQSWFYDSSNTVGRPQEIISSIVGKTQEITLVELQDTTFQDGTNFSCIIWEGNKMREFGKTLSTPELIWIVGEISDFLANLKERVPESQTN